MMIVDNKFKVDFFLDTNILVDYVQGESTFSSKFGLFS